jgi:hypothetical protein
MDHGIRCFKAGVVAGSDIIIDKIDSKSEYRNPKSETISKFKVSKFKTDTAVKRRKKCISEIIN